MTATWGHLNAAAKPCLYVSFELGWTRCKLAFGIVGPVPARLKDIRARDVEALRREIAKAKERFGLPAAAPVYSCYEAGRDGFWLHHWLTAAGIVNVVVDPSSIKVNGRRKRPKTDRLDARLLLETHVDHCRGEKKVWSVVRVPTLDEETRRQLHREHRTRTKDRTEHVNRMKGVLASLGIPLDKVKADFPEWLAAQRMADGKPVPADYQERLLREFALWQMVDRYCREWEREQQHRIDEAAAGDEPIGKVRKLMGLKGIGAKSAWLLTMEFFSWRRFRNRQELASLAGLTPTPYDSGGSRRDQGISKAGHQQVRGLIVELAWCWLHWQPGSALSQWHWERFGKGSSRQRKIGIVALARKLLVALWHYVEEGTTPLEAIEVEWQSKIKVGKRRAAA